MACVAVVSPPSRSPVKAGTVPSPNKAQIGRPLPRGQPRKRTPSVSGPLDTEPSGAEQDEVEGTVPSRGPYLAPEPVRLPPCLLPLAVLRRPPQGVQRAPPTAQARHVPHVVQGKLPKGSRSPRVLRRLIPVAGAASIGLTTVPQPAPLAV